jgi:hypothetical protein
MRNVLIALACALIVLFGVQRVLRAFESDEDAIRRQFQTMAQGFNTTTMRHALGGFHDDFRDESSDYDKQFVRGVLAHMFMTEKDELTRAFPYRVEIPESDLTVEIDTEDPTRAQIQVHAVFQRSVRGAQELYWDAHLKGEMRKSEGVWRLYHTREVNHAERRDTRD